MSMPKIRKNSAAVAENRASKRHRKYEIELGHRNRSRESMKSQSLDTGAVG